MTVPLRTTALAWLVLATTLAGCADDAEAPATNEPHVPRVDVTSTTGGIRGIVVDQAIVPITGALVEVVDTGKSVESGANGEFAISGLEPSTYFVRASHPRYDVQQQAVPVEAGNANPPVVRIQLTQLIVEEPTWEMIRFDGYISCSANILVPTLGGFLSEECGEGAGSPEDTCFIIDHPPQCIANPILPGERIGKADGNQAQIDFFIQASAETLLAEVFWKPSLSVAVSPTGQKGTFNMGIYTGFICDPFCGWDEQIDRADGESPLYLRSDTDEEGDYADDIAWGDLAYNETTRFSTFTWAGAGETGMLVEQSFEMFVTASYYLPLPEEWSMVDGTDPF